ncbi:MAG: hypothetical protein R2867_39330 [Caldilineaceae bacterium]
MGGAATHYRWPFIATAGDHSVPDTVATDPTLPHVTIDGVTFTPRPLAIRRTQRSLWSTVAPGGDYGYSLNPHQLADKYHNVFYDQRARPVTTGGRGQNFRWRPQSRICTALSPTTDGGNRVHLVGQFLGRVCWRRAIWGSTLNL